MLKNINIAVCTFLMLLGVTSADEGLNDQAMQAYRDSNFLDAVSTVEEANDKRARLIHCLSLFERYELYRQRPDKEKAYYLYKILAIDLTYGDIDLLTDFFRVKGKEASYKKATDLLEEILDKPLSPAQCRLLASRLSMDYGTGAKKEMLRSIHKFCRGARRYVSGGGRLPEDVIELFQDAVFVGPIAELVLDDDLDSLAIDTLEKIEEPALPYMDIYASESAMLKAIAAVKKRIAARQKKHPEGSWFSAYASGNMGHGVPGD